MPGGLKLGFAMHLVTITIIAVNTSSRTVLLEYNPAVFSWRYWLTEVG